ncbi:ribonuclease H-like domain-containing protein [Mycena filopes]|nr:ribonuclease H-like domain-containing protein [Mycena filopes]
MPLVVDVWTDGACRNNGYQGAVGGAGVWFPRYPRSCQSEPLPSSPKPTNQRAELTAVIMALEEALRIQSRQCSNNPRAPFFILNIKTDSQYAVNCLTLWINNWRRNGWMTRNDRPVANVDLIERADELRDDLEQSFRGGEVNFTRIARRDNAEADRLANRGCDEAERIEREENTVHTTGYAVVEYDSDSDSDW